MRCTNTTSLDTANGIEKNASSSVAALLLRGCADGQIRSHWPTGPQWRGKVKVVLLDIASRDLSRASSEHGCQASFFLLAPSGFSAHVRDERVWRWLVSAVACRTSRPRTRLCRRVCARKPTFARRAWEARRIVESQATTGQRRRRGTLERSRPSGGGLRSAPFKRRHLRAPP